MAAEIASWGDISALGYKDAASGKNLKYCPSKSKIIAENISLVSPGNNYANARLVPKNYVLNPTNSDYGFVFDFNPIYSQELSLSSRAKDFLEGYGGLIPIDGSCQFRIKTDESTIIDMNSAGTVVYPYDDWLDEAVSLYDANNQTSTFVVVLPNISYYIPMSGPSGNVTSLNEIEIRYFMRNYMNGKTRADLPSYYGNSADGGRIIYYQSLHSPSIITFSAYDVGWTDWLSPEYPIFGFAPGGDTYGLYPTCKRFDMLLYNADFEVGSTYSLRRTEPDHKAIIEEIKKQEPKFDYILDSSGNPIFQIKIQSLPIEE